MSLQDRSLDAAKRNQGKTCLRQSSNLTSIRQVDTIPKMGKLTRIKIRFCLFSLCLLITCNPTFAFFKKPEWLSLSHKEVNFWSKLSKDFTIECDVNNPIVQKQIHWYQQHPKHLHQILKGAEPFIHYVYEQTHRKKLPAELALIPLLESQYNPAIGARSGAAGLWQMMPGTATKFGLKINHTYDGRRDVIASTKAALTYLSYLHRYFNNNWLMALAAYDAGEGKVLAIARRSYQNFWQLPLCHETKEYVPKLLAIACIIKQPGEYHIILPNISKEAPLQEIAWNEAKVNLSEMARNLGVDDRTLKQFNPGIRSNVADVPRSLTLLIPGNITPNTLATGQYCNEGSHDDSQENTKIATQITYKIKKHDTLNGIAKKFHVAINDIKQVNHITSNKLRPGKILKIPHGKQIKIMHHNSKKYRRFNASQNIRRKASGSQHPNSSCR